MMNAKELVSSYQEHKPSGPRLAKRAVTVGSRFEETKGHSSGFNYLRIALALSIICLHSAVTSYGMGAANVEFLSPARPLIRMILPAFFALSGFLVAGSLERSRTLVMYLSLRALRIYPALIMETTLSALIVGPLLTSQPLTHYFSDAQFREYLLNIVGDVHFYLPGLFPRNPLPHVVNGQLWTVPFELYCYLVMTGLAILGVRKRPILAPLGGLAVILAYLLVTLTRHHGRLVYVVGAINGALLIATFLFGVGIYFFRHQLPFKPGWGIASGLLAAVLLGWGSAGDFFAPLPVAYFTVFVGLQNPPGQWLAKHDYSYGIFLYGFMIQQAVVSLIPLARHYWFVNLMIDIPVVVGAAAMSWNCFEKPAQMLRKPFKRVEDRYLAWRASTAAVESSAEA